MEEEFEKWAEKKARVWVDNLIAFQRKNRMFLSINNLEHVIIKALREGRAYGKNDVEK